MPDEYMVYQTTQVERVFFAPEFWIRVRSKFHPKMRALQRLHTKKYRAYSNGYPPEIEDKINVEWSATACEEWGGAGAPRDAADKPLACTPENAAKVMAADEWLRSEVYLASVSRAAFEQQELEDLGKSSAPSSAPTSSDPTVGPSSEG